jgi:Mg/Co/Ni transporter MgtE
VTENGTYLGLLSENDLACFEPEKKIDDFRFEMENFFVTKETAWLDVLEMFSRNEANILPVLDEDQFDYPVTMIWRMSWMSSSTPLSLGSQVPY